MKPAMLQFGNLYQVFTVPASKEKLKQTLENASEELSDNVKQLSEERYLITLPGTLDLNDGEQIAFDFGKPSATESLASVDVATNQTGAQKPLDLSVFQQLKTLFERVGEELKSFSNLSDLCQSIIQQVNLSNTEKQPISWNIDEIFKVIPDEMYENLNQIDHGKRTPLTKALVENNYELSLALILHPGVDVNLANGNGKDYTPLYYLRNFYEGPHKDELKQALIDRGAKK